MSGILKTIAFSLKKKEPCKMHHNDNQMCVMNVIKQIIALGLPKLGNKIEDIL